ncbi:uncharacterized protein KNAG_0M02660 [Huiozyma naganishii CBS 8797]|uniref:glutaminase n=1 Tax=Huiozyma naganishii (strain ATCC MYA-139 / BCRC 22969 / CBS 8797 / KCTC 17520 / NBRC 10181 / NCYC 3082 / Yp74L-3) TaxID=1071383 RepID=J7SAW9_HUIN7|nr:hypothetical protein KNAG_0M02660 [Kazachstania naganishii CBS 8797]CCK73119.1 hypothetical protein KNAG_0M02660 [Kazachstania naganishii CBS 8797]
MRLSVAERGNCKRLAASTCGCVGFARCLYEYCDYITGLCAWAWAGSGWIRVVFRPAQTGWAAEYVMVRCVIGVLALQGAFIEHVHHLEQCIENDAGKCYGPGLEIVTVKESAQLWRCDALVIPGGESTSMSLIAQRNGLFDDLYKFVRDSSKAIWGTCAGLIFLAEELSTQGKLVKTLQLFKGRVRRNAFGRQAQSFTQECDFSSFIPNCSDFPTTFIRAPVIEKILDPEKVEVLYKLDGVGTGHASMDGLIVAARQGQNVLVTSFHPELAADIRFHDWFIKEFVLKL